MKVVHIINNLGSGGAEKLLEELVPILNISEEHIKVDIVLLTDENNVFDSKLKEDGIKITVIKLKNIYNPLNIYYLIKIIEKGRYDIVHSHLFPTQYWVALASQMLKKKRKIKFVTTEHSSNNRRRNKFYFRILDRYIYSKYDEIISITENTKENLIEWIKPKENQIYKYKVIENGVNLNKIIHAIPYKKSEINKKFTEHTKLICMVGRFAEPKDQSTLIKALAKLPSEINLLLIGEGPLIDSNIELARKLDLEDRVHFLGFRNDIERILKTVDIVVLSSRWEGLSLSSIEGLASGKPFIASDVQGLREIVSGYGILFDQGNDDELCSQINSLLNDKKLYYEVAQKCIDRSKKYNINYMVEKLLHLYRN